jgi:hypothetical protein
MSLFIERISETTDGVTRKRLPGDYGDRHAVQQAVEKVVSGYNSPAETTSRAIGGGATMTGRSSSLLSPAASLVPHSQMSIEWDGYKRNQPVREKPMPQTKAETYRRLAEEARAKATSAAHADFKRQWNEIAGHYDMLAALVEKNLKP